MNTIKCVLLVLSTTLTVACGSYKGNEMWRRSVCDDIVDTDEKAYCLSEATRPEKEYKNDVKEATESN